MIDKSKLIYLILTVLIGVLGWQYTMTYSKLIDIDKTLIELRLEVVKMQAEIVTREDVEAMIDKRIKEVKR